MDLIQFAKKTQTKPKTSTFAVRNPGINGLMDTFAELTDGEKYHRRRALLGNEELEEAGEWEWDTERFGKL